MANDTPTSTDWPAAEPGQLAADQAVLDEADQLLADGQAMLAREAGARLDPGDIGPPVSLDDLRIVRGEDGLPEPIGPIPTVKDGTPVCIYPLTMADQLRYRLDVADDIEVSKLPVPRLHQIVTRHMAAPSFADVTPEQLQRDFGWMTVYDLALTILVYSRDMFRRPLVKAARERAEREAEGAPGKS